MLGFEKDLVTTAIAHLSSQYSLEICLNGKNLPSEKLSAYDSSGPMVILVQY